VSIDSLEVLAGRGLFLLVNARGRLWSAVLLIVMGWMDVSLLDKEVSPKAPAPVKRKISRVAMTKKISRKEGKMSDTSLGPGSHPLWSEVVRKGKWGLREARPKRLKQ
jgi:hypothetical protein